MKNYQVVYSVSSWLPVTMTWIYTQIKYLENFMPLILTDTTENLDALPKYPVYSIIDKYTRFLYTNLRKAGIRPIPPGYHAVLQEYRPTTLHSHFGDRAWYDLPMAKKHGLKQIVTFYGYDLSLLPKKRPVWRNRYRQLFERAVCFLCEGPYMAQTLANLGCPQGKIRIHRLGVDLDRLPFIPRSIGGDGEIKILIAGRFIEKKGIPYALEALGRLKEQHPNLRVTLIGDSSGTTREEREKTKIIGVVQDYQLQPFIKMLGFQPIRTFIEEVYKHHIFLSPSVTAPDGDTEGGAPVSIIEALASGMPVVSSKHCDIPGVITHGISGLLAIERDVDSLTHHLQWLIEHPEHWPRLAEAGRKHIEMEFNARIQGQRLMRIYEEI